MKYSVRWSLSGVAIAGIVGGVPLFAQSSVPLPIAAPVAEPAENSVLDFNEDAATRMTVPVTIGQGGPYQFVVDTGAERTVISRELARKLALGRGNDVRMHSMNGVGQVSTVIIPDLGVSNWTVKQIHAPALAAADIGGAGMLGVDSLKSQRVVIDFNRQTMAISPSRAREENWGPDTIVVKARSRYGRLVFADAMIEGERVYVILDTGSQASVGNDALRRRLMRKGKLGATLPIVLVGVTGGATPADYTKIKELTLGGVTLTDMPIAFAEVHPFRKLKLDRKPALLLGMDSLRAFKRVSVDFATRKVRFLPPDTSQRETEAQMAWDGPPGQPAG